MTRDITTQMICRAIDNMDLTDMTIVGRAVAIRIRDLTPDASARQRILQQMDLVEELSIDLLNRTALSTGEKIFDFLSGKAKEIEKRVEATMKKYATAKEDKEAKEQGETSNTPDPSHDQSESS